MKSNIFILSLVFLFTGCAQNLNELGQNISNKVQTAFLIEKDLKVGVKKAYISQDTDAKSQSISEVRLDEELKVIGLKDNEEWYKVLTPNKEGYIPKSAMIDVTIGDSLSKLLGFVWGKTKNKELKTETTFEAKNKKWSDHEKREERLKVLLILKLHNLKNLLDMMKNIWIHILQTLQKVLV